MSPALRRTRLHGRALLAGALTALTALAACSEATAPPKPEDISLTPFQGTIAIGSTLQFAADVLSASGSAIAGFPVQWSSSAPLIATVSGSGLVTALATGSATITATAGTASRSADILVRPAACAAPSGGALVLGGSRNGNMATSPCTMFESYIAVGYTLSLDAASGVSLSLSTSGFYGEIVLTDASGLYIGGSEGRATARTGSSLAAGTYHVWIVADVTPTSGQTFTLSAVAAAGGCSETTVTRILDLGTSAAASVSKESCVLQGGPAAEGWRLLLTDTTHVRVSATSAAYAPTSAITSLDYQSIFRAAIGGIPGTIATSAVLPPGEYLVWGGSFDYLDGTVEVRVDTVAACVATGTLTLGVPVNGQLAATDCPSLYFDLAVADVWTFTVTAATTVRFDLSSTAFDTYLELRSANDALLTGDDDGGPGLNSQITTALMPGTYRLWASSYSGAATGAYVLSAAIATGAIQTDRAPAAALSSRLGKLERPRPSWPARRTDGNYRK